MEQKNTIYPLMAIDLTAFIEYLEHERKDYTLVKVNHGKKISKLKFTLDRYTMDTNGYHIGYEYYHVEIKVYPKKKFNIYGFPSELSAEVIFPNSFTYKAKCPKPIYNEDKDEYGERECLYYPPDDDFIWQEINSFIERGIKEMPSALFYKECRQ